MKTASTYAGPGIWFVVLCLLAGCSTSGNVRVDASGYAAMGCNELNDLLRNVSRELSQLAITRGKVAQTNVPSWVPGGRRVAATVIDRQTAKIGALQQRERSISAARDRNCSRR